MPSLRPDPPVHVSCPKYWSKTPPGPQNPVLCRKPAGFRERTFDANSGSSDKVCDKVSGKGRLNWDLSAFDMSKLQSGDMSPRSKAAPGLGLRRHDTAFASRLAGPGQVPPT